MELTGGLTRYYGMGAGNGRSRSGHSSSVLDRLYLPRFFPGAYPAIPIMNRTRP